MRFLVGPLHDTCVGSGDDGHLEAVLCVALSGGLWDGVACTCHLKGGQLSLGG